MQYKPTRPGYLNIKEAATRYEVSRGKLHRLIRLGRLKAVKDVRDARATLVKTEDLEEIFQFPLERADAGETGAGTSGLMDATRDNAGTLTTELRARMDAIRTRIAAKRGRIMEDSADVIRNEREKRGQDLYELVSGTGEASSPDSAPFQV